MISNFFRTLFSTTGLAILVYIIIGIFVNTASPHIPQTGGGTAADLHSWTQYIISVVFWPLSLWKPTLTLGEWTGVLCRTSASSCPASASPSCAPDAASASGTANCYASNAMKTGSSLSGSQCRQWATLYISAGWEVDGMLNAVSLHTHTTYSFLDGYGTPDLHAQRAAELGYSALAVTEHGNVSSHFRFEKAAQAAGIKPIFGIEAYTGSVRRDKRQQTKWHLTVLAENEEGYRELNRAVTASWRAFYYHPTLASSVLTENSSGLTVLSGCSGSLLACTLTGGKGVPEPESRKAAMAAAQAVAERFRDGLRGHYYLEVQAFPELETAHSINTAYAKISKATGIPLVATLDVHYPRPEDSDLQVILHACGPQGRGAASADEMLRRWNYDVKMTLLESDRIWLERLMGTGLSRVQARSAIENTRRIADYCNVSLPKAVRLRYPCPPGKTATDLIWDWLREGWKRRGIGHRSRKVQDWYWQRLQYEMKLVLDKDFVDFFLATADVVIWCKDDGNGVPIPVGPGRGSAAASLVCWLLRITEIDPGRYTGMMFERFIDVNRSEDPDIDIDFADDRRAEVRDYLADKYGPDCVGTIANFVRYRGKNSLVDVARVHNVPKYQKEIVSNLVIERSGGDARFGATLEDTVATFPAAAAVFADYPSLWLATRLEGNVRGMSIHAAGLVVANSPLTDVCAVYEQDGRKVLSIDKYDAEYAGMLKMDFLGLTTMGMVARCLELTGLKLEDLYAIRDTDTETLDVFRSNDVIGIFQFEGRATRIVCRNVHPDNFAEVADINALSRPGPLFSGTTTEYCDVKHGRKKADRWHAITDEICAPTYGQIIYQEQILSILQRVGGFDWTDLNEIRRIIAKKIGQAAFQVSMDNFVEGAGKLHGIKPETAETIWKHIVTSGTYAFNIAHAISYSMLAWWCAYLKAHYPAEFYAASLSKADPGSDAEFHLMRDAQVHGIRIKPPHFATSGADWTRGPDNTVVAGLRSVPGIGGKMAARILEERAREPFADWTDMRRARGIGTAKIERMKQFAASEDPFKLEVTAKAVARVVGAIEAGDITAPLPDATGDEIAALPALDWNERWYDREPVVYAGVVKARLYQDMVENLHTRTGRDPREILAEMDQPELTKYCILHCVDSGQEEVYVRITRFSFPRFKSRIDSISVGHDVLIVVGKKQPGFGNSVGAIKEMYVVDPD